MYFGFDEEERMIIKSVNDMMNDWSNGDKVRMFMEHNAISDDIKQVVSEMGILGILEPDNENGEPIGIIKAMLISREAGRATFPYPLLEGIVGLYTLKHDANHGALIEEVEEGKKLLTISWDTPTSRAFLEGDSWVINGKLRYVPFAKQSDVILASIYAAGEGNTPEDEHTLVIIDRNDPAVSVRSMNSMDETYPIYEVTLSNYRFTNKDAIKGVGIGNSNKLIKKTQALAILLLAAEMSGGAERVLYEAIEYTKLRKQFGTTIALFQALQHKAADMWVMVESMNSAVDYAAWAMEVENDDWETAVAVAKSYASDAYKKVAREGIQLHGGIGYCAECDMHLFFKRAYRSASFLGDGYEQREELAKTIFDCQ